MTRLIPSARWAVALGAFFVYGLCFRAYLNATHGLPTYSIVSLFGMGLILSLAILGWGFAHTSMSDWVFTLLLFVPYELSVKFRPLPSLSPIDLFCLVAFFVQMSRLLQRRELTSLLKAFGWPTFISWMAFIAWGIGDAAVQGGSAKPVLRWMEFLFMYGLVFEAYGEDDGSLPRKLLPLLALSGLILGVVGLFQFVGARGDYREVTGTFLQHNVMGHYLLLCAFPAGALWIRGVQNLLWGPVTLLILAALFASFSRGAWLGLGVGLIYLGWALRARWAPALAHARRRVLISGLVLFCGTLAYRGASKVRPNLVDFAGRTQYWEATKQVLANHPWAGLGPGNYDYHLSENLSGFPLHLYERDLIDHYGRPHFWIHLHNLYFQIAVEYGLLGLLLWLIAMGFLWWGPPKLLGRPPGMVFTPFLAAAVVGFFVHNLVDIMTVSSFDLVIASYLALNNRTKLWS